MISLSQEFKNFLEDIEKNIKNKEDIEFIKNRLTELEKSILDKIEESNEEKINTIMEMQKSSNLKLEHMNKILKDIAKDIYDENEFDFDVICPYCNHEFEYGIEDGEKEVECPECKNVIELDWNGYEDEYVGCYFSSTCYWSFDWYFCWFVYCLFGNSSFRSNACNHAYGPWSYIYIVTGSDKRSSSG